MIDIAPIAVLLVLHRKNFAFAQEKTGINNIHQGKKLPNMQSSYDSTTDQLSADVSVFRAISTEDVILM